VFFIHEIPTLSENCISALIFCSESENYLRFQVLTAASMMFRAVFWVILPCKMIVDNHYNPEDSSEHENYLFKIY
jgi:hypothetical protein